MYRVMRPAAYRFPVVVFAVALTLAFGLVTLTPRSPQVTVTSIAAEQADPADIVSVVLPTRHIAPGEKIQYEDITRFELPVEYVPAGAVQAPKDAVGTIAKIPLICGQPIQSSQIAVFDDEQYFPLEYRLLDTVNLCLKVSFEPLGSDFEVMDIPVALQNIAPLTTLQPEMFTTRPYPAQLVPIHIHQSTQEYVEQRVLIDTPTGTMLTPFILTNTWLKDGDLIEIPRSQVMNDTTFFHFGDEVRLTSPVTFIAVDNRRSQTQRNDAEFLERPSIVLQEFTSSKVQVFSTPRSDTSLLLLGVSDERGAKVLDYVVKSGMPILLVNDIQTFSQDEQSRRAGGISLDPNSIAILVDIKAITTVEHSIETGDKIELTITGVDNLSDEVYEGELLYVGDFLQIGVDRLDAVVIQQALEDGAKLTLARHSLQPEPTQ